MQGTFIGFNTAGITFEDRFLALLLKIKQQNGPCQQYYLQAPILLDLLLILQNRLLVTYKRLHEQGETYKEELIAYNESLIANIPAVEMAEIQQPNPERRIMSITLKPGETESTLILVLQNEQICTLCIEDRQVEALLAGVQQALKTINDQEVLKYLSSNMDFLMCYTVDLTTQPNIDYQQHTQEDWKLNLFSHYLGVLYCCETDEGKKIVSGAVVKNQRAAFVGTGKQRCDADYREKPQAQGDARGAGAMPDLQYYHPFPAGKNAQSGRMPASPTRLLP